MTCNNDDQYLSCSFVTITIKTLLITLSTITKYTLLRLALAESHLPCPDSLPPCLLHCPRPARHRSTPSLHPLSCAGGHWSLGLFSPGPWQHTASTLNVNDIIHSFSILHVLTVHYALSIWFLHCFYISGSQPFLEYWTPRDELACLKPAPREKLLASPAARLWHEK